MITLIVPTTDARRGEDIVRGLVSMAGTPVYPVVVYDEYRTGYTSAVNLGLMTAMERGEDACICVDDVVPVTENWLRALAGAADLAEHIWFAGPSGACRTWPQNSGRPGDTRKPHIVSHVAGFCWLIKREALRRIGFLRAELENYGSDVDYQWRAQRLGGRTIWAPHVFVRHELHAPRQPFWDQDNRKFDRIWG